MFWIFKITPDFIWMLIPVVGLASLLLSKLSVLYLYKSMLSLCGTVVLTFGVFMLGMLYANNQWQQAARELQAKVEVAEAKSQVINEVVKERLVTKTQIVKQRGETVVKYIDREVVKLDENCKIPQEFVRAHNQAATK